MDDLKRDISENYYQFDILQLLDILHENFPETKLFFESDASLAFPASDISAINMNDPKRTSVRLPMANLLGVTTPLPIGLSDYISRGYKNSGPLQGFMSVMQNRIHNLWLKALRKYNIWRDGGKQAERIFEKMSMRSLKQFEAYDLFWLAAFSRRVRSVAGLKHVIRSIWKGVPVRITENVGRWTKVENRRPLGGGLRIGKCSVVGSRVFDRTAKFRVSLGPVDIDTYRSLLPEASGSNLFKNIISLYINEQLICEQETLCFKRDLDPAKLGDVPRSASKVGGLGRTMLLGRVENTDDCVVGYRVVVE